jgi:hypothetical protein
MSIPYMVWKGAVGGVRFVGRLFVLCLMVALVIQLAGPVLFLVSLFLYGAVRTLIRLDRSQRVEVSSVSSVDSRRTELMAVLLEQGELGAASEAVAPLAIRNSPAPLRIRPRSIAIPRKVS